MSTLSLDQMFEQCWEPSMSIAAIKESYNELIKITAPYAEIDLADWNMYCTIQDIYVLELMSRTTGIDVEEEREMLEARLEAFHHPFLDLDEEYV